MKKTAYVVGNCQARALESVLNLSENFRSYFEFSPLPAVHVIKPEQVQQLHEKLPSAGLLIGQFVSEHYRNRIGLGLQTLQSLTSPSSIALSWPSIYWDGYNPELFYFKNENGASFTEFFDYHHLVVYSGYIEGRSISEVSKDILNIDRFSYSDSLAQKSLSDLASRESKLDLKVASFISSNFKTKRLFWTFNHPASPIMLEVAQQTLKALDITDDLPDVLPHEVLNNTIYPILPSVKSALGLTFENENGIVVRGDKLSIIDAISKYYFLYDKYPDLVKRNINVLNNL